MPNIRRKKEKGHNIVSILFDAAFFFERGVRSHHRNDIHKALKYFERCVNLDPTNSKYLIHLAAIYTETGQFEESNRILNRIIHNGFDGWVECYYYMANNYAHMGEFEQGERYILMYMQESPDGFFMVEAEELLDFICYELDREPKRLDAEYELISKHEKAQHCLEEGKFVEATKLLEQLVSEYPHFLAARNNLALSYYYIGQFDRAFQILDDILEQDPNNLHALCNAAIFHDQKGQPEQIQPLVEGLKKIQPLHVDHHIKLATSLGILGEDERAYELFLILIKNRTEVDVSWYHYLAVAAFNTKRWEKAKEYWHKAREMDPHEEVANYYLQFVENLDQGQEERRLSYHYQLPYDVHFKQKKGLGLTGNKIPADLLQDPIIRSSLFWVLRHGDQDTKLQVIQAFLYVADQEAEEALRQMIEDPHEEDYVKKVAIFVLRQMGAKPPYRAYLDGKVMDIDGDLVDEKFPVWLAQWQKVIQCLKRNMEGTYGFLEYQEAQSIWTKYLRMSYPHLPKIRKAEAWAAAIEYMIASQFGKECTKTQMAKRYGVSISTLTRNVQLIEESIFVNDMTDWYTDEEM